MNDRVAERLLEQETIIRWDRTPDRAAAVEGRAGQGPALAGPTDGVGPHAEGAAAPGAGKEARKH